MVRKLEINGLSTSPGEAGHPPQGPGPGRPALRWAFTVTGGTGTGLAGSEVAR